MSPLMTMMIAETGTHDRVARATRFATRARHFFAPRGAHPVERPELLLALPGTGVRRPRWYSALDTAGPSPDAAVGAGELGCAHC